MVVQRHRVERGIDATGGQQRLHVGREAQPLAALRQVQRLDAEAVTGQEQLPHALIPDREREHAVEAFHTALAPGVVRLQDDLAVAFREERVAQLDELGAQLPVVVDRAVEYQRQLQRCVDHRLVGAGREVDD
jgi:hypothetical protein